MTYWTAFYTKPRSEKKTAERLVNKGYEIYCPTRSVIKQWSDRKKKISEPVFTSYIFAKVNEQLRNEILSDQGVVSNVFWLGKPAVIKDSEIKTIRSFLDDFPQASVEYNENDIGRSVEIESGPLSGQKGTICYIQGNRACLRITSLGIDLFADLSIVNLKKVS